MGKSRFTLKSLLTKKQLDKLSGLGLGQGFSGLMRQRGPIAGQGC